jgi:hypothetical protein
LEVPPRKQNGTAISSRVGLKKGKAFMVIMTKVIKDDVELGAHGKWEKLYKKICDAINTSDQIDQGSSSSDDKMDHSVLYAEV